MSSKQNYFINIHPYFLPVNLSQIKTWLILFIVYPVFAFVNFVSSQWNFNETLIYLYVH